MIQKYLSDDARAFPDARYKEALEQRIERLLTDFDKRGWDSDLGERISEESPREVFGFFHLLSRNANDECALVEVETLVHKFVEKRAKAMAVAQLEAEGCDL